MAYDFLPPEQIVNTPRTEKRLVNMGPTAMYGGESGTQVTPLSNRPIDFRKGPFSSIFSNRAIDDYNANSDLYDAQWGESDDPEGSRRKFEQQSMPFWQSSLNPNSGTQFGSAQPQAFLSNQLNFDSIMYQLLGLGPGAGS